MTRTLISSHKQEIIIGCDAPFCVIGERINPTGRKLLAAEMAEGDYSRVVSDALAQVEAGATMLDINAGIPMADEPAILAEAIKLVQSEVDQTNWLPAWPTNWNADFRVHLQQQKVVTGKYSAQKGLNLIN